MVGARCRDSVGRRRLAVAAGGCPMLATSTKLLDTAMAAARGLPPAAQDDIARVVLQLLGAGDDAPLVPLAPDERAAVAASKAAAARGEFATEEEVRAVWAKHGL